MTRYTICARPSSVYVPVEADSPQEAVEAFLRVNAYEIESVDWGENSAELEGICEACNKPILTIWTGDGDKIPADYEVCDEDGTLLCRPCFGKANGEDTAANSG